MEGMDEMKRIRAGKTSFLSVLGLVVLISVTLPRSVQAVVIRGGDGSGNISAPVDDPGWANVGKRGVGSAVYLGDGWCLTAAHVGAGSTDFGGTSYDYVTGSGVRLHEPGDESSLVDLYLYRLTTIPIGLSGVTISSSAPSNGSDVVAVGYGRDREVDETNWDASWVEGGTPIQYRGFKTTSTQTKSWGENDIDASGFELSNSWGDTYMLRMDFDRFGAQGDDEMQVIDGDSGGALFFKNGDTWELSGILLAMGVYEDQPDYTTVYGNKSYAGDLSRYYDQIMGTIPEPGTLVLLGLGGLMLFAKRRRRRYK